MKYSEKSTFMQRFSDRSSGTFSMFAKQDENTVQPVTQHVLNPPRNLENHILLCYYLKIAYFK